MAHRVAVLAPDGVLPLDLGIPAWVLNEACAPDGTPLCSVSTFSIGGGPVRTHEDFRILLDHDESLLGTADTVVIATVAPGDNLLAAGGLPDGLAAVPARSRPQTRIVSPCTSAFLLAAAGLLDGLRATTHRALCDSFARLFPGVEVDPNVLSADNGRVPTSAGGAAGIDLCLHLVRRDHGAAVAAAAARRCVAAPWREGGQAQFSVRTFTRRFRSESRISPLKWLGRRRVAHARLRSPSEGDDQGVFVRAGRADDGGAAGRHDGCRGAAHAAGGRPSRPRTRDDLGRPILSAR
ncbi:DJ-1/PfpI family protein [Streptomyces sp. NPDC020983]|uniref:DJ-1/PfpI family protein n=1 Tax=Streptomyces sp. NPDC020983 TaxID=3365106 RepID=UPI003791D3A6